MATDWAPVAAAGVGATAAIVASALTAAVQVRSLDRRERREVERAERETRQLTYLDLLQMADQLYSQSAGALVGLAVAGRGEPEDAPEQRRAFIKAMAEAQFLAPQETWREMAPLAEAAGLLSNWASLVHRNQAHSSHMAAVEERMNELNLAVPATWEAFRDQYVAAARADLLTNR